MFWNYLALRKPQKQQESMAGFSLVELMISISIMVIVAGIILTRQSSFNGAVLLRGEAYDIALQIREVQLNAVSASGNSGTFRSVQGVQFDTSTFSNNFYRIFVDTPTGVDANGFYDSGEEFGQQGLLDPRFEIRAIRAIGTDAIVGTEVSVVFVRPNFDARFFDSSGELTNTSSVEVDIARRGATGTGPDVVRTLEITSTGQIAVQ